MSDRFFNRDRNRPYDDDFDEEFSDRDYRARGQFQRGEEAYDYGAGYPGHQYGQNEFNRGYQNQSSTEDNPYRRHSGRGYDRGYGEEMRSNRGRSGYGQDFESGQRAIYDQMYGSRGRQEYGYEEDYDRWNRGGYGPYGRSGRGQSEYGQGRAQGRQFGYGTTSGYGQDYGRRFNYDYDFDASPSSSSYTESWQLPGPFTGIGPEDYQRPDERIREDINERLTQHGRINARHIKVQVNNGEVTLTGMIDNRQARRMAEDVAAAVTGVKDVQNQLRIQEQQGAAQQREAAQQQEQRRGTLDRH